MVAVAARMTGRRRRHAQEQILATAWTMADPDRRFGVIVSLRDLPAKLQGATGQQIFDLAAAFDDADTRCRAMLAASGFVRDQGQHERALLAALAAAECVPEERRRAELLRLAMRSAAQLPDARREMIRVLGRMTDPEIQRQLQTALTRFDVYERPPEESSEAPPPRSRKPRWDLFISYSTYDVDQARFLASELKSRGMRVFVSADALDAEIGSATWLAAIDDELDRSRALLVLVTDHALASKWVTEEWTKYHGLVVGRGQGRLFSLRLGGPPIAELPTTLQDYQVIDSKTGRIEPGHLRRIMDIVRGR
jgi:hypothetical protein